MYQIENTVFKALSTLPIKFKPIKKALIYPIIKSIGLLIGYIALCYIISKMAVRLIINKL